MLAGLKSHFRLSYLMPTKCTYLDRIGTCKEVTMFHTFIQTRYPNCDISLFVMYFDTINSIIISFEGFKKSTFSKSKLWMDSLICTTNYQMESDDVK